MPRVSANHINIDGLYPQRMRDLEIKPSKDRLTKAETAKTIGNDKKNAIIELNGFVTKMQSAMAPFASLNATSIFNLKKASALTKNDVGNGSDYMNVSVDSTVPKGEIDIRINNVAIASSVTVGLDNAATGFPHPPAQNSDLGNYIATRNGGAVFNAANPPKIVINYAGVQHDVNIQNGADTIYNIRDYINTQLSGNNLKADVISNATGDFLVVSSTVTGANALEVNFENSTGPLNNDPAAGPVYTRIQDRTVGVDASVTIKGVVITSPSNIIKDVIPGVTVELKKPNDQADVTKNLTVEVTNVVEPITNAFVNLVSTYNEFIEFSEAQTKTIKVNGVPKAADDAFLYNSVALKDATDKIKQIVNLGSGGVGQISFLFDIGIGFPKPLNESEPRPTKLEILDSGKLRDAIVYNLDGIKEMFQKKANVTKVGATTANLTLNQLSEIPAAAIRGTIQISEDGLGNVTFTLPGDVPQNATLTGGTLITFPNTVLQGLSLNYIGGSNGAQQNFDVDFSQGIADRFASQTFDLNLEILKEGSTYEKAAAKLEELQQAAQIAYDKKVKEIDDRVAKLEFLAMRYELQMDNLDQLLEGIYG